MVTLTPTGGGGAAVTVTVAEAFFVLSAALVAVTVAVPAVAGAVKSPDEEMVPLLADQVAAVLVAPLTVAVNCRLEFTCSDAEEGPMLIVTAPWFAWGALGAVDPPHPSIRVSAVRTSSVQNIEYHFIFIMDPLHEFHSGKIS